MPRITQLRDDRARIRIRPCWTPKAYKFTTVLMWLPINFELHMWPPFEVHVAFLLDRLDKTGNVPKQVSVTTTRTFQSSEGYMP